MDETLLWIATHLDSYHFNTDRARLLKRKIQVWTTLTESEQETQTEELLRQFFKLFANNPWLEQSKLVTDSRSEEYPVDHFMSSLPRCGEITGASADAYFVKGMHYVLKPPVLDANGANSVFMNSEAENDFIKVMEEDAMAAKKNFVVQAEEVFQSQKSRFSYILLKEYNTDGFIKKSPGFLSAVACIFYMGVFIRLMMTTFQYLSRKIDVMFPIPISFLRKIPIGYLLVILSLIMLVVIVVNRALLLNTVVKGLYRTGYVFYMKRMDKKIQKLKAKANALECSTFFINLRNAIEKSKEDFCQEAVPSGNHDRTRELLKNTYDRTYIGELSSIREPWSRYSRLGEENIKHLSWLVIFAFIILYIVVEIGTYIH